MRVVIDCSPDCASLLLIPVWSAVAPLAHTVLSTCSTMCPFRAARSDTNGSISHGWKSRTAWRNLLAAPPLQPHQTDRRERHIMSRAQAIQRRPRCKSVGKSVRLFVRQPIRTLLSGWQPQPQPAPQRAGMATRQPIRTWNGLMRTPSTAATCLCSVEDILALLSTLLRSSASDPLICLPPMPNTPALPLPLPPLPPPPLPLPPLLLPLLPPPPAAEEPCAPRPPTRDDIIPMPPRVRLVDSEVLYSEVELVDRSTADPAPPPPPPPPPPTTSWP